MSLCYDFEKWTIISLLSVAISLTVGLVLMQNAHGQTMTQEQRLSMINYCYQHADRPNPIDDLIDKGFLSPSFKGQTCLSVKQSYDKEQIRINNELKIQQQQQEAIYQQQQEAINKENQAEIDRYHVCLQSKTNEECEYILDNNDTSDSLLAIINNSTLNNTIFNKTN